MKASHMKEGQFEGLSILWNKQTRLIPRAGRLLPSNLKYQLIQTMKFFLTAIWESYSNKVQITILKFSQAKEVELSTIMYDHLWKKVEVDYVSNAYEMTYEFESTSVDLLYFSQCKNRSTTNNNNT